MNELSFNTIPLEVLFPALPLNGNETKEGIFHKTLWIYLPEPKNV